jgi:hypothetical protein
MPGSLCPSCIVDVHIDVHGDVHSPGKGPAPVARSARVVDARAVIGRLRRGVDTSTPCLDGPGPTQFDTMDEAGLVRPAWMNEPVVGPSPPVNTRDRVRWDDGVDPHCVQVCVSNLEPESGITRVVRLGYKAKRRCATKESAELRSEDLDHECSGRGQVKADAHEFGTAEIRLDHSEAETSSHNSEVSAPRRLSPTREAVSGGSGPGHPPRAQHPPRPRPPRARRRGPGYPGCRPGSLQCS